MKKEDKILFQAIDDILWYDWDPINLNDNEEIRDEYQGYTPHIFTLKKQGADVFKLSQHLYRLETIDMGMTGDKELVLEDCKIIAQKIIGDCPFLCVNAKLQGSGFILESCFQI